MKTLEQLELYAEPSLEDKISNFINKNNGQILEIAAKESDGKLGSQNIDELIGLFYGNAKPKNMEMLREQFAKALYEKNYSLRGSVVRVFVGGEDLNLLKRANKKNEDENNADEIEIKRRKLPPQQRGLPNADL